MQTLLDKTTSGQRRLRRVGLASIALALAVGACADDPVVYPNRNLRPAAGGGGGAAGEAGALPEAGETGAGTGGAPRGGAGGSAPKAGGAGLLVEPGDEGGEGGMPMTGPTCGDGKVEAPEECEDGNTISGDGCSANCQSACEICEKNVCPTLDFGNSAPATDSAYDDCYNATGIISTGPAMGVSRAEVCRNLVDCIRREGCAQTKGFRLKTESCWCAMDANAADFSTLCSAPATYIPGKCAQEYQEAAESPSLAVALASTTATNLAEGRANRLLQNCDARDCTEECVPSYFGHGTAAKITADILAPRNDAGESALGDLLADAWRSIAQTDFALLPPGAIAESEVPALLFAATPHRAADGPGLVLWSEARAVTVGYAPQAPAGVPFDRSPDVAVYKLTLSGQKLYDALTQQLGLTATTSAFLHVSGLTYTWDSSKQPPESKLVEVRKGGVAVDKAATYTVALGSSLIAASGKIPALAGIANPVLVPTVDTTELLGEYLSQLPQPVAPPELNRITKLP